MQAILTDLSPGALVYLAWADSDETIQITRIRVQATHETDNGWPIVDASNSARLFRLAHTPPSPCIVLNQPDEDIEDGTIGAVSARPVFAIAPKRHDLLWQTQRNLIEMGYGPTDALDLTALRFGIYAPDTYAALRDTSEQSLRDRVDEIVAELIETGKCSTINLDLHTIEPDWIDDGTKG